MKTPPPFLILYLIVIVLISGCTQTASDVKPEPVTTTLPASVTTVTTVTPPPATLAVPPKDPIIGSWMSYKYLPSGKIELYWTFSEHNTWTLVNTNVKSQKKKFVHGTWRKTGADTYQIPSSSGDPITFTYDRTKDEFSDTFFLVPYTRITGAIVPQESVPTMNLTLSNAQLVSQIYGSHPYTGHKYLIANISIKNINETGWFDFTDDHIWAIPDNETGSYSMNQKLSGVLENPFPAGKIVPGETRQGNVVFGVPEKSQSFTLKLVNNNGDTISNTIELDNMQANATYSASST